MSNSKLATVHYWTKNYSSRNGKKISTIIIHHMAGNLDAKGCYNVWKNRQGSAHYAISSKGEIGQLIDEKHRAWSVANASADSKAVTMELANDGGAKTNWHVSDKAIARCIDLCVDICQRNGIKKLNYTGDKKGNLLMHRYFMATACPGPYLAGKFKYIANEVNKRLGSKPTETLYRVRKTWADAKSQVGAYKVLDNAKKVADEKGLNVYDDKGTLIYQGKKKEPDKQGYVGKFPTYKLTKTNAQAKADVVEWGKKIAANNDFHYGHGKHAHHNGCFYCGTQPSSKKKSGIKKSETTYCCNPFVGACWAHGGGDATAFKLCRAGKSWDCGKGQGYDASKLFDKLGKPDKSKLKAGDVLCGDKHVALYIGGGKVVHASREDNNVVSSKSWNSSISIGTWNGWKRAYRYNGYVDCDRPLTYGEYSDRVGDLQNFLIWYGAKLPATKFFNKQTLDAVKKFQADQKLTANGVVDQKTIDAMKAVKK